MIDECSTADPVVDADRLAALRRTGLLDTGPEDSFERLGALAKRLTGASAALVSLVDHDRQCFKCCLGLPDPWESAGETPLSHSICKHVLGSPEPLIIPDTATDPRLVGNRAIDELGVASYLGIPLMGSGGHVLGSFCVLDRRPREWTADDVAVMTDLASSVMAEIELREVLAEREHQREVLVSSEARLRAIMDGLFIFVGLLDVDGTLLEANTAALDAGGVELDDVIGRPFWEAPWWAWDPAVQEQLRAAIERAAAGHLCRFDVVVRLAGDVYIPIDFQLAPLVEANQVVRLIPSGLDISDRKRFESDLQRLAAAEARSRNRAERLLELSRSLSAAIGIDQVAGLAASTASEVAEAAFCNIAITTDTGDELELRHGPELDPAIGDRWPRLPRDLSTPLGVSVVTGRAQFVGSSAEIEDQFPTGAADAGAAGFQSLAALPIPGFDGAIGFAWTEPQDFPPAFIGTLELLAELIGQALSRAVIHQRDRRVAEQLQRNLLPAALPAIPGTRLAAKYEAGGAGLDIGGDWYDVGSLGPGRWVLAVGDVVGRGLRAASVMGHLRSAFSALATNSGNLGLLVDRLDLVASEAEDSTFSTMVAVEYHDSSGSLSVLSAGHPPPFVRRADGRVDRIDGSGRPVGIQVGDDREAVADRLGPGDLLVLYTDGLIERRGESIDVGLDRLADALGRLDTTDVEVVCATIFERLDSEPTDDIALLVLLVEETGRTETGDS